MSDDLRDALERAQGNPPPWRHTVDDFVVAGRRRVRRRRARIAVGSSALTILAAGGLLAGPTIPEWLRLNGSPSSTTAPGTGTGTPSGPPARTPSATPTPTGPTGTPSGASWYVGPPHCSVTTLPEDFGTTPEWNAFFEAGYTYDDSVLLARLWGAGESTVDAKVCGGGELLRGRTLPLRPGQTAQTAGKDAALQAYANNGYTAADAAELAKLWRTTAGSDLTSVKVRAGREILDGRALPLTR